MKNAILMAAVALLVVAAAVFTGYYGNQDNGRFVQIAPMPVQTGHSGNNADDTTDNARVIPTTEEP